MSFTEKLEAYNEAIRYAEKEARQRANGTWRSAACQSQSKVSALSVIKERFGKEFAAVQDFLSGKIESPEIHTTVKGVLYTEACLYFECPDCFEKEVASLESECHGDLSESDMAWIENTQRLISKYSASIEQRRMA